MQEAYSDQHISQPYNKLGPVRFGAVPKYRRNITKYLFGITVVLLLGAGLFAVNVLRSEQQDVRQQAYEGGALSPQKEPEGGESLILSQAGAEIDQFMNAGAKGFLVWQYSGYHPNSGGQWFENDSFSFFRSGTLVDDEVCFLLREKGAQYNNREVGIGVNIWSFANYQPLDHLTWLKEECGVKTVRVFAKVGQLASLAAVADAANQAGVQLIVTIGDYSNGGGGMPQAANKQWYESDYKTVPYQGKIYRTFVQQVATALAGKAIFAYELANEPHCAGDGSALAAYKNWGTDIARLISASSVGGSGNATSGVALIGFGQMASQQTTRCDSPGPGDFQNVNSIADITVTSAHYYNETEKNSALLAVQQSLALNPAKPFYIGEAKAFDPNSLPTPQQRYWFQAEVLNAEGQIIQPPIANCGAGVSLPLTISCSSSLCIRHAWKCHSEGGQLISRTNAGQNTVSLSQPPTGYECTGWKLIDATNGSTLQAGTGCVASFQQPAADWQRKVVFTVRKIGPDWSFSAVAMCDNGYAPRNYPVKAEWAVHAGTTNPQWQSDSFATGMHVRQIHGTDPNQSGYFRMVDQAGNYLQPIEAWNPTYFTFGQLFTPARWTAKWRFALPEGNQYIRYRPAASVYATVCSDPAVTWNLILRAECPNGQLGSGSVNALYTLWPPIPLSWTTSGWFSGQRTIVLQSTQAVNTAYMSLYAAGHGYLQPKTPVPAGMVSGQFFSPPTAMVKWPRTAVSSGTYTIRYAAPSSWCSGALNTKQEPLTLPVFPVQ